MADDATVRFGYDGSELDAGLRGAERRLTTFGKRARDTFGSLKGAAMGFAGALAAIAFSELSKSALDSVLTMDRMERALTNLEGSAEGAQRRMEELRVAALLPGVDFQQAVQADIKLRSVGYTAEESKRMIIELGNEITKTGGTSEDLEGVIIALSQVSTKGKLYAEELNQMAERIPTIRALLIDMFGSADTEVLQKMGVTAEEFKTKLLDALGAGQRAVAGLDESVAAMKTNFMIAMEAGAGPLIEEMLPALEKLTALIIENKDAIREFGQSMADSLTWAVEKVKLLSSLASVMKFSFNPALGVTSDFDRAKLDELKKQGKIFQFSDEYKQKHGMTGWSQDKLDAYGALVQQQMDKMAAASKAAAEDEKRRKEQEEKRAALKKKMEEDRAKRPVPVDAKTATAQKKTEEERKKLEELKKKAARDDMSLAEKLKDTEKERAALEAKAGGTKDEAERLRIQQEILKLQMEEKELKEAMAQELKDSAEEAMRKEKARIKAIQDGQKELERLQKEQEQKRRAAADFAREMEILEARVRGDKKRVGELERQARIEAEKLRIMQEQGVSEAQALEMARQKIALEDKLERKSQGREERKRINAHIEGGAAGARARAAERAAASEQKRQAAAKASWKGLDGYYADQTKGPIVADTPSLDRARGIVKKEQEQKKPQGLYEVTVESKELLAKLQADMAKLVAPT